VKRQPAGVASVSGAVPGPWKLCASEIHVWCLSTEAEPDAVVLAGCEAVMTAAELARRARFVFARDRAQFTLTRALIRTLLSNYLGGDPSQWVFSTNQYGKPALVNGPPGMNVAFNLSHTRGLIACALGLGTAIGVDVEAIDRHVERALARRFFSSGEVARLDSVPDAEFPARFLECWTAKEAYIKAVGGGLSVPLDDFSIVVGPGAQPRLTFSPRLDDDESAWQLAQQRVGEAHVMALAVRRSGVDRRILVRAFDEHDFGQLTAVEQLPGPAPLS